MSFDHAPKGSHSREMLSLTPKEASLPLSAQFTARLETTGPQPAAVPLDKIQATLGL